MLSAVKDIPNPKYFSVFLTEQADGDAEIKDGSFTETLPSASVKQSLNVTGKKLNFRYPECELFVSIKCFFFSN